MTLNHQAISDALQCLGVESTPSDVQGLLSAFFCQDISLSKTAWVDSMLSAPLADEDHDKQDAKETLVQFYEHTQVLFDNDMTEFELLMPKDDMPFEIRLQALVHWVQGFLSGIKLLGMDLDKDYGAELNEVIQDLFKISVLGADEIGEGEEVEASLMELYEFTKVAVQLLYAQKEIWGVDIQKPTKRVH